MQKCRESRKRGAVIETGVRKNSRRMIEGGRDECMRGVREKRR